MRSIEHGRRVYKYTAAYDFQGYLQSDVVLMNFNFADR